MANWTHRYGKINGINMHWVEEGEGPLVILAHGFPHLWFSWRHQIKALAAAGIRVIAPDQRGYGNLPSLHIAMSLDSTLLDMVSSLACTAPLELFNPAA